MMFGHIETLEERCNIGLVRKVQSEKPAEADGFTSASLGHLWMMVHIY